MKKILIATFARICTTAVANAQTSLDTSRLTGRALLRLYGQGLSEAVVQPEDKLMYAMLKLLVMEPGKPFKLDARVRGILQRTADTGAAMITSIAFASRVGPEPTWPDRRWEGSIL
jgi:hypothetical protein